MNSLKECCLRAGTNTTAQFCNVGQPIRVTVTIYHGTHPSIKLWRLVDSQVDRDEVNMGEQGLKREHKLKLYNDGIGKGEIMPEMTIQFLLTALLSCHPRQTIAFPVPSGHCLCQYYCKSFLAFPLTLNTGRWTQKSACLTGVGETLHQYFSSFFLF